MSTVVTTEKFRERLARAMKRRGIIPAELARLTNLTSGYISQIQDGLRNVSAPTLRLISMVLGVNEMWLVHGQGEMVDEGIVQLTDDERQCIARARRLDPEFRETLSRLADQYLEQQQRKQSG